MPKLVKIETEDVVDILKGLVDELKKDTYHKGILIMMEDNKGGNFHIDIWGVGPSTGFELLGILDMASLMTKDAMQNP